MSRSLPVLLTSLAIALCAPGTVYAQDAPADGANAQPALAASADATVDAATAADHAAAAAFSDSERLPTETAAERFRWHNEEFFFTIEILGSEAARTAISIGPEVEIDGHGVVIPVEGLTTSVGFFNTVYPMRDLATTYIDPDDGLPVWASKELDERGEYRRYDVTYDHELYRADVERTRNGQQRYRRNVPSDLHDAVSWFLDLRSRDFSVGSEYVYHVYDGWKLSRLTVRIVEHEDIYTGLGFIPSARMRFTREVLSSYSVLPFANDAALPPVYDVTDGPIDLGVGWFSLDDRRLPVGVEVDAPIGQLRMILQRHTPPS